MSITKRSRDLSMNDVGNYTSIVAVTPSDATEQLYRALYVQGAGTLVIRALEDSADVTLTIAAAQVPVLLPIAVKLVKATGTVATGIFGLK